MNLQSIFSVNAWLLQKDRIALFSCLYKEQKHLEMINFRLLPDFLTNLIGSI